MSIVHVWCRTWHLFTRKFVQCSTFIFLPIYQHNKVHNSGPSYPWYHN